MVVLHVIKQFQKGMYDFSYLLSFRDMKRSGTHEINPKLLSAQSQAIEISILQTDIQCLSNDSWKLQNLFGY